MATQPAPPDGLPKYLAEGVPKQDADTLRAFKAWIDELLTYRRDIARDELAPATGDEIEAVEESSDGTVVIKRVSCGKDNCKCQRGNRAPKPIRERYKWRFCCDLQQYEQHRQTALGQWSG